MAQTRPSWHRHAAVPYVAPFALFVFLTAIEGWMGKGVGDAAVRTQCLLYCAKFVCVTVTAILARSTWQDLAIRPSRSGAVAAVMIGIAVTVLWVGLSGHYPVPRSLGIRSGFNPLLLPPLWRWPFLLVRFAGLVILIPVVEELFWRSFLMRWIQDPRIENIPVGRVTRASAAVTSLVFASAHPEWLPAILAGLAWALLLRQTRSVSACVLSHAVANLGLGIWILATQAWRFW